MKGFLLFIAFVALAAFAAWQHSTISSLNLRLAAATQELAALRAAPGPRAVAARRPQVSNTKRIICPACHGEKVIVYDPSGTNNPLKRRTQTCPVCVGVGYRVLTILPRTKICPDCQGMGLVYSPVQPGQPVRAGNCARCGAKGLVAAIK